MRFLSLLLLLTIGNICLAQRPPIDSSLIMNWEDYDPPSTLVVPENPVMTAKLPFIDIHSHQWNLTDERIKRLVEEMDSMNMASALSG